MPFCNQNLWFFFKCKTAKFFQNWGKCNIERIQKVNFFPENAFLTKLEGGKYPVGSRVSCCPTNKNKLKTASRRHPEG